MNEEFSKQVTQDKFLRKFWQLNRAIIGNKSEMETPDFRLLDNTWVRTPGERGIVFLERYLKQTDQEGRVEVVYSIRILQYHNKEELTVPPEGLRKEMLFRAIAPAKNSSPGPDEVKCEYLNTLRTHNIQDLTNILNDS